MNFFPPQIRLRHEGQTFPPSTILAVGVELSRFFMLFSSHKLQLEGLAHCKH